MSRTVEQFLDQRAHRETTGRPAYCVFYSLFFHGSLIAAVWFVPELFAKPPELKEYVSVTVVPPQMLGTPEPPPPPPPPKVEPPPPEPPPPEPEPIAEDAAVLVEEKKVEKRLPPPKVPKPPPPPPKIEPPPKRIGSPFGNPLGATKNQATVGVEDPNFTYGYYLDRMVAVISSNWVRPPMGTMQARLHFRIERDGTITELRVMQPSGEREFDEAALRAVTTSSPLPPLPKGYTEDDLGITLIVE